MLRLNLGSGPNVFPNWVNVDIEDIEETYLRHLREAPHFEGWPEEQRKLGEYVKAGGKIKLLQSDIADPMSVMWQRGWLDVSAIYLGQVVEHLNPIHELPQLLKRCYDLLKPGGRVRITTPDLVQLLQAYDNSLQGHPDGLDRFAHEQPEFYKDASPAMKLSLLMFGSAGPNCTRSNYEGHFACYDWEGLAWLLVNAGFVALSHKKTPSGLFHDVIDCGMSHSFAIEAEK